MIERRRGARNGAPAPAEGQATTPRRAPRTTSPQAAARSMLAAAERDLQQIILDIHDGPVQDIFVALSQIHILRLRPEMQVGDSSLSLARIAASLERALGEIRSFIGAFRPPEFERRSLGPILEGLVVQHEAMTGNTVDFQVEGSLPDVSLSVKIALYRILQEALANATRHAGVKQHHVRVAGSPRELRLDVRDSGKGFDVDAVLLTESHVGVSGGHFGLRGMRDRVEIMNGTLAIDSGPHGTHIAVRLPVASERA